MTTNIFQILAAVHRRDGITLEQAQHLERVTHHESYRHIIDTLEQRTPNVSWLCCDGSGLYFPDYQEARTVGQLDGDTYFLPYLQHNEGSDYQQARDRHGDVGYTTDSDAIWVDCENEYITQDYYERGDFGYCGACGEVFQTNDLYWREHNEETYCESCDPGPEEDEADDCNDNAREGYHPPYNINNGGIYNYSRKVEEVIPVDLEDGIRYFGIELEQEFPGETPSYWADWAMSRFGLLREVAIWKADGSLSEGAELVSVPQTLSVWQSTEDNPIRDLCNDKGWRKVARSHKTTTCGLHVHVSRNTIPEPVIAKLVVLLNDDSMRELTTLVARRAPNTTYCMASKKKWHSCVPNYADSTLPAWARARTGHRIPKRQYTQGSRYTPVNITEHTLEFRIFRGTLKWETILASIEFCDAVISYCTQHGAGAMNSTAFRKWLATSITRKTYPALRDYLELRCVLPKRKAKPDIVTDDIVSEPEAPPASFVMDPYDGVRPVFHTGDFTEIVGDHYIAFRDYPVQVRRWTGERVEMAANVQPGEIWWNSTRTCSLRVEPTNFQI